MRSTLIKVAVVAAALVSAAGAEGEAGLAQPVGGHAQHHLGGAGDDGQHHAGDLHERADDGVQHPALPSGSSGPAALRSSVRKLVCPSASAPRQKV